MNTNKKLERYLKKLHRQSGQHLYLHSEYDERDFIKRGTYFEQEIHVAEYSEEVFKMDLKAEAKRLNIPFEELWLTHEEDMDNFVSYYDKYLFTIRTLDDVMTSNYFDLGHTPYYQRKDWERLFTVQKFGQLTDEDIFFAIKYFINKVIDGRHLSNIVYNGKRVQVDLNKSYPDYKRDSADLKAKAYWKEKKYYGIWF